LGVEISWRSAKKIGTESAERPGAMPASLGILVHFSALLVLWAMNFTNSADVIGNTCRAADTPQSVCTATSRPD
jgi:hypothetical protein